MVPPFLKFDNSEIKDFKYFPFLSQVDIKIPLWTKEFKNLGCSKPFSKKNFKEMNFSMARADQIKKTCESFSEMFSLSLLQNQNCFKGMKDYLLLSWQTPKINL